MFRKERLIDIVGVENFYEDSETLDQYSSDHSFVPPRRPWGVVKPGSSEEVVEIVKWANEVNIPLIPVSSGPPRFRGDTIPEIGGVIVDLSRMNRIKMVDRLDRVVMVEPGVRWGELQEAVKKEGMRVPMPLSPRRTKSVIGSCLEREPHIIPKYHLDHSDPLLCNEVVFGTGDLFRTGEAAGPGTIEEQWKAGRRQKIGEGIQTSLMRLLQGSQGTFGIITWSTIKCEVLPRIQKPFIAAGEDLETLLEFGYRLVRLRLGDELFILNGKNLASLLEKDGEAIRDLKEALPTWVLLFCLAGYEYLPEERVEYQEKDVKEVGQRIGVKISEAVAGISAEKLLRTASNPSEEPYWKIREKGGCQDIYFITSFNAVPKLVNLMGEICGREGYPPSEVGVYIQPVCQGHGHHCEFRLPYDPTDSSQKEIVKSLYLRASKTLMENGAFFSRPYDLLADIVFDRDAVAREVLRRLKNVFDPKNIMNPGKLCF